MNKPTDQVRETESTRQPSAKHTAESHSCNINTTEQLSKRRAFSKLGSVLQALLAVAVLNALLFTVIHAVQLSQLFRDCKP